MFVVIRPRLVLMLSEFPASVVCGRCRGVRAAVSAAHGAAAEADGGRGQRGVH